MDCDNNLFHADSYDTPEHQRSWLNRLVFGCRWHFHICNSLVFLRTGCCARKGNLDKFNQIEFSNKNIRIVEHCGGKIHLRGLDNLRQLNGRSVILMGNHMSSLETAVMHAIVRPYLDFTFVIKESLMDVAYFGDIMRALDAIPVGRDNPREDLKTVMQRGQEILKSGRSIIIFPQATRSEKFEPEHFNTIGIKLAKAAGVDVVPFALKTNFVKTGTLLRDFGPVCRDQEIYFDFGTPLTIHGNGKEEHAQVIEFIQKRLAQWNSAR